MKILYSNGNNEEICVIDKNGDIASVRYSKAHTIYGTFTPRKFELLVAMLLLAGRPDIAKELAEVNGAGDSE